ncbi:hypothetical protein BJY04DRAFT_192058 [Aspergillus karnatakaensis]|uniref:uncharacterized protein n=1 Tax=Aspergillus karnatakaensis TaxID=1810916 RepID=UPI003CCCF401
MGLSIWRHLGMLLGLLSPAIRAQACDSRDTYHAYSQAMLDAISQNCPSFNGTVRIGANYTGPLILHNVTDLTGIQNDEYYNGPGLTSLEFPDLVNVEYLNLSYLSLLEKVSFPKLEYAENIQMLVPTELPELQFPSLKNTTGLRLEGNLSRVSFGVLDSVYGPVSVCSTEGCYESGPTFTTMKISFPALKHVQQLEITGNVSSLSIPELASIVEVGGLKLEIYGSPVAVDFPKLSTIEGHAFMKGSITSLNFPLLREYPETFGVKTSETLQINLPGEKGNVISLLGSIKSAQFPNLTDFKKFIVQSSEKFDCGSLIDALEDTAVEVRVEKDENVVCRGGARTIRAGLAVTPAIAGSSDLVEPTVVIFL